MEAIVVNELVSQGVLGIAVIILIWFIWYQLKKMDGIQKASDDQMKDMINRSEKREERLMNFTDELSEKQAEIASQIFMVRSDVADIRRRINIKKGDDLDE